MLHYFDEECSQTDCYSLEGEICDNCRSMRSCNIAMTSKRHDFSIIADAIDDLPRHGIVKVQ